MEKARSGARRRAAPRRGARWCGGGGVAAIGREAEVEGVEGAGEAGGVGVVESGRRRWWCWWKRRRRTRRSIAGTGKRRGWLLLSSSGGCDFSGLIGRCVRRARRLPWAGRRARARGAGNIRRRRGGGDGRGGAAREGSRRRYGTGSEAGWAWFP